MAHSFQKFDYPLYIQRLYITMPFAYSEFTVHMYYAESTLDILICRYKCGYFAWRAICFSLMHVLQNRRFWYDPTSLMEERISHLNKTSVKFDWHTLYWFWFALCLKCSKSASMHKINSSILDVRTVCRSWRRFSWIIFIGIRFSNNDAVKVIAT